MGLSYEAGQKVVLLGNPVSTLWDSVQQEPKVLENGYGEHLLSCQRVAQLVSGVGFWALKCENLLLRWMKQSVL